jgi:hypothetical protein
VGNPWWVRVAAKVEQWVDEVWGIAKKDNAILF